MDGRDSGTGIGLAFVCLGILGILPIIANSRPAGFGALGFALFLSLWQLLFTLPLFLRELGSSRRGVFGADLSTRQRRRTIAVILFTGLLFGLSTWVYVLAMEKAGAVSAAIAIQAYPLFAILWESLFLGRRKTPLELAFTGLLIAALTHLATQGTWRIEGFSAWFAFALLIPFLWSVAHVIIKEVLTQTPITPIQVIFFRVSVSSAVLLLIGLASSGLPTLLQTAARLDFQMFALLMGFAYFLELVGWFHAVRHIDVSLASSITVPAPAVTLVLAVPLLGEPVSATQTWTLALVAVSVFGLLFAGKVSRSGVAAVAAPVDPR